MRRPHEGKLMVALGAVALAALLFFAFSKTSGDSDGDTSSGPTKTTAAPRAEQRAAEARKPSIQTIAVRGGEPVGGVAELTYDQGQRVRFKVSSDVADEIHLHGYDISKQVKAGGSVAFDFPAEIEGIFEVELEERAVPIAELRVEP